MVIKKAESRQPPYIQLPLPHLVPLLRLPHLLPLVMMYINFEICSLLGLLSLVYTLM